MMKALQPKILQDRELIAAVASKEPGEVGLGLLRCRVEGLGQDSRSIIPVSSLLALKLRTLEFGSRGPQFKC